VEADAVEAVPDEPADVDEAKPQRIERHAGHTQLGEPVPQGSQEPGGHSMELQREEVGEEAVVREPITGEGDLTVPDPVLRRAPTIAGPGLEHEQVVGACDHGQPGIRPSLQHLRLPRKRGSSPADASPCPSPTVRLDRWESAVTGRRGCREEKAPRRAAGGFECALSQPQSGIRMTSPVPANVP
jgi:hypothetical protein